MHTVELLDEAIDLAKRLDYVVRQDFFGGCGGGGGCELRGRKLLFIDLDLDADERFEQVASALRHDPATQALPMSRELVDLLKLRKIA